MIIVIKKCIEKVINPIVEHNNAMKDVTNNKMSYTIGQIPIPWIESSPLQRVLEEREREKEEIIEIICSLYKSALKLVPPEARGVLPIECEDKEQDENFQ